MHAKSTMERLAAVAAMMLGCGIFGVVMGNITAVPSSS
jgi:hypothetical protein